MEGKVICPVCHREQDDSANFCYSCGEPLTEKGKTLVLLQRRNTELTVLIHLLDVVKDERTIEIINKKINELSK